MSLIQSSSLFVQVILPLPLTTQFTYRVPTELNSEINLGKRVIIQFGTRKYYAAIIYAIHSIPPQGFEVKEIISVLDEKPIINEFEFRFWNWISSYYMCTLGEVMKAAIPAGLKLESETRIFRTPDIEIESSLSDSEELIIEVLTERNSITIKDLAKIYKKQDLLKIINRLVNLGILTIEELMIRMPQVKSQTFVELMPHLKTEDELKKLFGILAKAPKQLQILMNFIHLAGGEPSILTEVNRKSILAEVPGGGEALKALVHKNILRTFEKDLVSISEEIDSNQKIKPLSEFQNRALTQILSSFKTKSVILLHGYTASGKTELYIHLIDIEIQLGKQVLYLLPEIALTAQIINRLKIAFGDKVGIYHSKFSDSERVQVWNRMLQPEKLTRYQLILGVRSSVFLPFDNLGLVIVDEEHENSYKQFDPAPRYHARDSALMLAQIHGARAILGTATPSVESYYNAEIGKYGLVELFQRYSNVELPESLIANIADARKRKKMKSIFHPMLIEAMMDTLNLDKQIILFHNRRGFSPYMQCSVCQSIPKCKHCDVSLTYHKYQNLLVCHYCGYSISKVHICPVCNTPTLLMHGFGTEKIEDELATLFPGHRIVRMDLDSTRSRKTYENIILGFENQEYDILVGTQMVTKGLDFDNVNLVGILDADQLLNYPDFRAYERSFQLMSQVSGRAGRKDKRGKVIIQTTDVDNYIINDVINNDFKHMYFAQLVDREKFRYPPYSKLIQLTVKHRNQILADEASKILAENLRRDFGDRVLGPEYPLINKISNWYQKNILLKIERQTSLNKVKEIISRNIAELSEHPDFGSIIVQPNVDPM